MLSLQGSWALRQGSHHGPALSVNLLEESKSLNGNNSSHSLSLTGSKKHACSNWKRVKSTWKMKTYLRYYTLVKSRQPAEHLWWRASTYCSRSPLKKEKAGVKGTALLSCSKTPMLETQSSASSFIYFSHSSSLTECCVVPWFSLWFRLQSSRLLEALQTGLLVPFNPSAAYPEHFLSAQHPPLVTRHFLQASCFIK